MPVCPLLFRLNFYVCPECQLGSTPFGVGGGGGVQEIRSGFRGNWGRGEEIRPDHKEGRGQVSVLASQGYTDWKS